MKRTIICHILFGLFLFSLPLCSWAAPNPLSPLGGKPVEPQPSPPAAATIADEEINASREKLESRLAELHLQLLPDAVAALNRTYQNIAAPEELQEWERLTNRLAGILDSHVNTLIRL
ncbi:MAG TPA: hypothetical protein VIH45_09085, partial [Desulfuromonadaceae bacterium]